MEQEAEMAIHPLGPTPGVVPVLPSVIPDSSQCELAINVGVFFDGTGNNKDWDDSDPCHVGHGTQTQRRKESNVARLFFAYPEDPSRGSYPYYISGVGTPFAPIGEIEPAITGMAFGGGGDGRINFGLLQVLNSIHRTGTARRQQAYSNAVMMALCRNGMRGEHLRRDGTVVRDPPAGSGDEEALWSVGMVDGGLLMDTVTGNRSHARAFYRREVARLAALLKQTKKPKLVEIFIDVFGFSRGAASARTFCAWLDELFEGDTLCGVPAKIRFLGIFDTVSSVGVPNNPRETYGLTNGHMAWGAEKYLRVPARIKNCVHFVAMHENRTSFPSDRVWVHNGLPSNCHEYAFPGMHSDVGGGYGLIEQGRGQLPTTASPNQLNSEKLSQIPLEAMLRAAQAAKVPLDTTLVEQATGARGYDPFAVDEGLRQAYAAFHAVCSPSSRQPADWLITYLAWRYQVRTSYVKQPWYARASASDRDDLVGANAVLIKDIEALEKGHWELLASAAYDAEKRILSTSLFISPAGIIAAEHMPESSVEVLRKLAPEALTVLERIKNYPAIAQAEANLFSTYAHDSVAGFRPFDHQFKWWIVDCKDLMPGSWEPEGYLRYRRFYTGYDQARTYTIAIPEWQQQAQDMQSIMQIRGIGIGDMFNALH